MKAKRVIGALAVLLLVTSNAQARFSYEEPAPLPGTVAAGSTISFSTEGEQTPVSPAASSKPVPMVQTSASEGSSISPANAPDPAIQEAIESARRARAAEKGTPQAQKKVKPAVAQQKPVAKKTDAVSKPIAKTQMEQPVAPLGLRLKQGSLRNQLEKYCAANGSSLAWRASTDIMISNDAIFDNGSFEGTLKALFEALNMSGHYFKAEYFRGNNLLLVDDLRK